MCSLCFCRLTFSSSPYVSTSLVFLLVRTSAKQKPAEKPSAAGGEHDALPTHVEPMQVASAKVQQYSKCTAPVLSMQASKKKTTSIA